MRIDDNQARMERQAGSLNMLLKDIVHLSSSGMGIALVCIRGIQQVTRLSIIAYIRAISYGDQRIKHHELSVTNSYTQTLFIRGGFVSKETQPIRKKLNQRRWTTKDKQSCMIMIKHDEHGMSNYN